jgi:hypothetical protein
MFPSQPAFKTPIINPVHARCMLISLAGPNNDTGSGKGGGFNINMPATQQLKLTVSTFLFVG